MNIEPISAHTWHAREATSLLRSGRWHIRITGIGHRHPSGNYPRECGANIHWRVLPKKGFGVGAQLKWGTNGSDTTPDISVHLGRLADIWVQFSHVIPYSWLERHRPDGSVDYDSRVFSLNIGTDRFRWECWARDGHWSRSDPKWMQGSIDYRTVLFGREEHTCTIVDEGTCVIPLPEANYPATYKIEHRVNRRTRPLGRLRDTLLGAREWHTIDLTPGQPIIVPGKGENSWDCDDDHLWSQSSPGRSVAGAIGSFVESVLSTRERHGGQHMNIPAGAA